TGTAAGTATAGTGTANGTATGTAAATGTPTATATPASTGTPMATGTATDGGQTAGTVLADDVDFQNSSGYVTVPAGDYTVEIREATPGNDGTVLATVDLSLESGMAYTALARGLTVPTDTDMPFEVQLIQDATFSIRLPETGGNVTPTPTPGAGTATPTPGAGTATATPGNATATPGNATATPGNATETTSTGTGTPGNATETMGTGTGTTGGTPTGTTMTDTAAGTGTTA
ncbi:MAG: DUF4397 domain-containing protein, partial [Haloarculaceae archaeon]